MASSASTSDPVGLRDFKIPVQKISPLVEFRARNGDSLAYRIYPSWSENLLMLIHGVGGDSRSLAALASHVASVGLATVVTPDLREHGVRPHSPRASVDRSSQLEQDLEETLIHVRQTSAATRIVLGGHSLGAALATRLTLSGAVSLWQSGLLLVAPYLPESSGAAHPNWGGWIERVGNSVYVRMPEAFRTGHETLEYDESFLAAAEPPSDWRERMASEIKIGVVFACQDRVFDADRSAAYLGILERSVIHRVDTSHYGVVGVPAGLAAVESVLRDLF